MRSTFSGLEIARTGLTVSQMGLDVTGHNIANVDTPGYTRQRLVTTAYEPYAAVAKFRPVNMALVGSGSYIKVLDQIRSSFLDRQYRSEQSLYSNWQVRTQGLTYVQSLFEGLDGDSLTNSINAFFSALNTETTEANDREQRVIIQEAGISLAQNLNLVYDRLLDQQKSQDLAVETVVTQINTIAENLAVLNKSIYSYEINSGQPANDLRDKRNLLLDELSALADIEYEVTADNIMIVKIGGTELVNHTTVNKLVCKDVSNAVDGEADVKMPCWANPDGTPGAELIVKEGELRAHLDLRDNKTSDTPGIPYFMEQLNTLARALVQEINAIHNQGYTHPSSGASVNNIDFFDDFGDDISQVTAGNIKLSDEVLASIYNIAASSQRIVTDPSDPDYLAPDVTHVGNQENIKALFNLIDKQDINVTVNSETKTVGNLVSFMGGIVLDVAVTLNHSKGILDTKQTQLLDVDNQRLSISGVSLDEEMTNLLKYQHAYSGAARVLTTMDEALDMLINRMGIVGRS